MDRAAAVVGYSSRCTFEQADAQVHPFPHRTFDVVISRHGSMFFRDASTAFTNIARAMNPGGRLVVARRSR